MCALVCTYVSIYMYLSSSPRYTVLHVAVHGIDQCVLLTMLVILQLNTADYHACDIIQGSWNQLRQAYVMDEICIHLTSWRDTNFSSTRGEKVMLIVIYVNQNMAVYSIANLWYINVLYII
jgi:hypothetical protein